MRAAVLGLFKSSMGMSSLRVEARCLCGRTAIAEESDRQGDATDIEGCLNAQGRCQSRVVTELFIRRALLQREIAIQEMETICGL
jgi:hypothetical protein